MPVSNNIRQPGKGKRRKNAERFPLLRNGNVIQIKPKVFDRFRENEDFINIIRVGHLLNALTYSLDVFVNAPTGDTPRARKYFFRTIFNSAAYIYERYGLVDSLFTRYRTEDFYSGFEEIRTTANKRPKKIVQLIRNSVAFHLDLEDKTRITLQKLALPKYDFVSGENAELGSLYFDLSDIIDLNFLIDELKSDQPEKIVHAELYDTIIKLMKDFAFAAEIFARGLSVKIGLFKDI